MLYTAMLRFSIYGAISMPHIHVRLVMFDHRDNFHNI